MTNDGNTIEKTKSFETYQFAGMALHVVAQHRQIVVVEQRHRHADRLGLRRGRHEGSQGHARQKLLHSVSPPL